MGSLNLPPNSIVYLDANALIYSVEKREPYATLLLPVWRTSAQRALRLVSSELVIVEVLVGPMKQKNTPLFEAYEQLFGAGDLDLKAVSQTVLRRAAEVRANFALKTPDAIHAATALLESCSTFLTNDTGFRRVTGLNVQILDEVLAAP